MADYQSEAELETNLVERLTGLGWHPVVIPDAAALKANLKRQIEKHNKVDLTDGEFAKVINHLDKGNVFDKAKILRDRMQLTRDDGSSLYLQFLNTEDWCRNEYQVTTQVKQEGSYKNRYDVTLLVNGLPLIQVELKRRGMELKEAFNQINRYQRHSYWSENGLFQYVQIFVISNGVNTKYYANNRFQDFKQTFYWAKPDNSLVTQLDTFADQFLEKCHASKMIGKYIVLHESNKVLMVLRPYQYYAVEAIAERVKNGRKNGYIWHTTGSGKTLTAFKASQVLIENPKVEKVIFVVDRNDLDYQTTKEFNYFSDGSVDGTTNTKALVNQLAGDHKLIVTTIQKLNTAISKAKFDGPLEAIKDKRVVFIFDECHRSQFGETHKRIVRSFTKAQLFGFTGTPIFAENKVGYKTTKDLFTDCLHKYVITDAIKDENVLRFSVEYWGRLKAKDGSLLSDEDVAGINKKEFFEHPDRIGSIVDWIIEHHGRKTHGKQFSAILCVSSIDALIKYYEMFAAKKAAGEHDLRVGTIFTYAANENDSDADGLIGDPDLDPSGSGTVNTHTRDKLDRFIADYNAMYQTAFSTKDSQSFYSYYKDIAKRMKERERKDFQDKDRLDILLVVNMFLTGFDAKKLNTLYVDKNLKYHGLIQAFSRTNRVLGQVKSQGNIVCFRNLKEKTDQAITLFSNKDAIETILMAPYEEYVAQFNAGVETLKAITPDVDAVNHLESEEDILEFIRAFRELIRIRNVLKSFTEFEPADLILTSQEFEDFKSKYLDIHDSTKASDDAASIIDEVDFELELIQRDEINVVYILRLLAEAMDDEHSLDQNVRDQGAKKRAMIIDLLGSEQQLRSKRDLIQRFIDENMPAIPPGQSVEDAFENFWNDERQATIEAICVDEGLDAEAFKRMISEYHFTSKTPLSDAVIEALNEKPKILERKTVVERVIDRLRDLIQTFDEGMG